MRKEVQLNEQTHVPTCLRNHRDDTALENPWLIGRLIIEHMFERATMTWAFCSGHLRLRGRGGIFKLRKLQNLLRDRQDRTGQSLGNQRTPETPHTLTPTPRSNKQLWLTFTHIMILKLYDQAYVYSSLFF